MTAQIPNTLELLPAELGKSRAPRHAPRTSTIKVHATKPPHCKKSFAAVRDLIEERRVRRLTVIGS